MNKIKASFKNKDGAALPLVLVVMLILTMFGTVLYMLAWNSFITVRYMNDQKKAYYFSRAGIEFAAYAYQVAGVDAAETDSDASRIITFSNTNGAIIKTNTIYVVPSVDSGTGKWAGLSFSQTPTSTAIGEISVEIGNGIDYVDITDADGITTKTPNKVKSFRSCAKSYMSEPQVDENGAITNADTMETVVQYTSAYLSTTETAEPLSFYDAKGLLGTDSYTAEDVQANRVTSADKKNKFLKVTKTIDIAGADITPSSNRRFFLFRLLEILRKTIIKDIFVRFFGSSVTVDLYIKTADGNLILSKPAESNLIKTRDKAHNYYIFATPEDLFLQDCGLNVIPTKGYYNSVGLYGDEIVIDGDIIMGVYYVKTDGFLSGTSAIINTIGNRYRLGTVMLGEGSNGLTNRADPVPINKGGIKFGGVTVPANKVYFNGNVYVKIFNQGGATETYRVFSAGDMAYFYGAYTESGTLNEGTIVGEGKQEAGSKGIDLLKYFLDAVIDGKEGFNYGAALIEKAKTINELYYTGTVSDKAYNANSNDYVETEPETKYQFREGDPTPYFNNETLLVRKIQVNYAANGEISVDGGYGSVLDLVQPSNIGSTNIKWGTPEGGSVFNPVDGNTY